MVLYFKAMSECIFCQIVKGKIPCYKIYEDEDFLAFLDVFPFTRGHTLVVTKKHVDYVWDYPQVGKYFEVVAKIAKSIREKTVDKIVRCSVVGTDVTHAHIHLLPGKKNDLTGKKLSVDEMEKIRKRFKM